MDLHQLEYILTIEQEKSISRAAERLFLTQPALNQQLLRLEKELGTPLFERRNRTMLPTYAGRIYLNTAKEMLSMKKETYKMIHDIAEERRGEISIAYTPEAGSRMFAKIYPVFHQKYPDITFKIHEARVKEMERLILQKVVDFACNSYYERSIHPDLEYINMDSEYMVLGVPSSHPLAHLAGEKSWETLPEINLSLFRDNSFILLGKETRMRDMIDLCFSNVGFSPKILFESISTSTVVSMVKSQIAPAFFPQSYVRPSEEIVYFTVPPRLRWMRSISFLKGSYLTKPEKYFIALATDYVRGQVDKSLGL